MFGTPIFFQFQLYTYQKKVLAKKTVFEKSYLTANLVTPENLEPIHGFLLEVKCLPYYQDNNTISVMYFEMVPQEKKKEKKVKINFTFFI